MHPAAGNQAILAQLGFFPGAGASARAAVAEHKRNLNEQMASSIMIPYEPEDGDAQSSDYDASTDGNDDAMEVDPICIDALFNCRDSAISTTELESSEKTFHGKQKCQARL
jgi:hypothetical protein